MIVNRDTDLEELADDARRRVQAPFGKADALVLRSHLCERYGEGVDTDGITFDIAVALAFHNMPFSLGLRLPDGRLRTLKRDTRSLRLIGDGEYSAEILEEGESLELWAHLETAQNPMLVAKRTDREWRYAV